MSIAARRSHRGDEYQLKIALHWMSRIIMEDEWEWIQIDAVVIPDEIERVLVDDIVVYRADGSYRFIQAKKNQTDHRNWSITDILESENQYGILYLKGDCFDDIDSENALHSRLNLTDDIVGLAARFGVPHI